ncbi:TetR/AcrR family transcriptional regulator [Limibaculum sp. M0105]|uniref:TetR/AcrR family transcriptional regulator n=1 Tax=Thermohalobaculum xanthum TaxID=2753746 RepID=A0A8J7SE31_9RHOB|nr:TetR/AcrR family transcriptional regulator [Thermohalobaculum xanthum]MBK0399241.1 TetR/AcrR family transcriptional regulator [Thermohalobaculum xanthum]
MSSQTTREQIVAQADALFYARGFEATSFSDIATAVGISRGNFYYHFRTKDEILEAVIARRIAATDAMLAGWEAEGADPAARIRCFIRILIANRAKIMLHGCPVGTLVTELAKLDHLALEGAARIFTLFRDWLARQFEAMGRPEDADALAMHVLARSQGVATLASAFHDESFIRDEVDRLCQWLDRIAGGRNG